MDNKIFNKYLTLDEKRKIRLLRNKISFARSVNEIESYKQEIGLIMTNMVERYSEAYNSRNSPIRKRGKATGTATTTPKNKTVAAKH